MDLTAPRVIPNRDVELKVPKAVWFRNYLEGAGVHYQLECVSSPLVRRDSRSGFEEVRFTFHGYMLDDFLVVVFRRSTWKLDVAHRRPSDTCEATYFAPNGDRWSIRYADLVPAASQVITGKTLSSAFRQ